MKQFRGAGLHVIFWSVYFGIHLFNDLYLSPSFTAHPTRELFFGSVAAQLLILGIKMPAVYYVLYSLLPRWTRAGSRFWLALEFLAVFFVILLAYRGMVQYVIRPFIFEEPLPRLTNLQTIARYFYSLLDLLQVTGIAAAIKLFRLRIAAVTMEKRLIREKLQSEMQHLRAQINPHFLFNTLNSIYALARDRSGTTPDAVMRLSRILRYMLYATEQRTVTIEEELKITGDYMELQQIRFGDKVRVTIDQQIDDHAARVTPQVLLPLVENAFKHGRSATGTAVDIVIRVELTGQELRIMVQNPAGTAPSGPAKNEGIGLANMRRRLQLLYREHSFEYARRDDTFVVELYINLDSYADLELPDRRG